MASASITPRATATGAGRKDGATAAAGRPLRVSDEGLALLRARLEPANRDNPDFPVQFDALMAVVAHALERLRTHELAPLIELVLTGGALTRGGLDLRTLPESEEVFLRLVVRLPTRDYTFDTRMSAEVFAKVNDGTFLFHFTVLTLGQWQHALGLLDDPRRDADSLGIQLLVRS